MNPFSHLSKAGFTFMEVLAASMIASFVAGGTMLAFVTAARITSVQNHASLSEANSLAAQGIEKWHNRVAADDNNPADPTSLIARANLPPAAAWVSEPIDAAPPAGTESIRGPATKRCSRVRFRPCPSFAVCYQVETQVCWNTGPCNCP